MTDLEYKKILDFCPDGIVIADIKTKEFLYVNRHLCETLGYTEKELKKLSFYGLHPKQDIPRVEQEFMRQARKEITLAVRIPCLAKDGSIKYFDVNTVPVEIKGKKVNIGFFRDITEKLKIENTLKQIEQAFKESQKRYHQLFENSRDGFVFVDNKGCFLDANKAYCDMLGYSIDELKNKKNFYEITPGKWHEWERKQIWEKSLMKKGYSGVYEKEYIRKDGTIFPIEIQCYTVYDEAGDIDYLWGIVRDITERKKALEQLEQSQKKYKILYESSNDAIMTLEPPDWLFTAGNPATIKMFGADNEAEFTSKKPYDLSPPIQADGRDSMTKALEMINTAMQKGSHFFEWTHKRINGEEFPATVLLTRVNLGDKGFLQATVRDITEQKNAQEELKKKMHGLEVFYKAAVDRELKMKELQQRILELESELGDKE